MAKIVKCLILGVIAPFLISCGGPGDGEREYNTNGIEDCETNGQCGGCCSHHGGVACRNGVTVCWDGSPLSSTCRQKGCSGCVGCGDSDRSCEPYLDNKGDPLYVDRVFEKNCSAESWFHGPKGFVEIDLPPTTLIITLRVYPYHVTHQGEGCFAWEQTRLGLYFEAECDGCDETVEWIQDSCHYEELRFPFRPHIYFEPIGDGLIETVDDGRGGSYTSTCDAFATWPCVNDKTGFVSGWLFFPESDHDGDYSYSDIERLVFSSNFSAGGSGGNTIGYIDMFELR